MVRVMTTHCTPRELRPFFPLSWLLIQWRSHGPSLKLQLVAYLRATYHTYAHIHEKMPRLENFNESFQIWLSCCARSRISFILHQWTFLYLMLHHFKVPGTVSAGFAMICRPDDCTVRDHIHTATLVMTPIPSDSEFIDCNLITR